MQEKLLELDYLHINYKYLQNENNKKTILILHGWGGSSDSWVYVAYKLYDKGYNVIVPDLPGFGKSDLAMAFSLDDYAKVIEEFTKKLSLKGFILMGHSNGGAISIRLVIRGIIQPIKLILNNSAGIRNKPELNFKRTVLGFFASIFKKLNFLPGYEQFRSLAYRAIGGHDYLKASGNKDLRKTMQNMLEADLQDDLLRIKLDTLLIWGENDIYTPLQDGFTMNSLIKNSKIVIIGQEGHSVHLNNPDRMIEIIEENL